MLSLPAAGCAHMSDIKEGPLLQVRKAKLLTILQRCCQCSLCLVGDRVLVHDVSAVATLMRPRC